MKIVAGLGNPGERYARTRHNLGFLAADRMAAEAGAVFERDRFESLTARVMLAGSAALLLKPQTYMNLSGASVGPLSRWLKVEPEGILVICDDINLEEGRIRFRKGGADGGHKGLASVIGALGTQEIPRLRLGVGSPAGMPSEDWVLKRFTGEEDLRFEALAGIAAEAAISWAGDGIEACMNRYNGPAGRPGEK